MLFFFGLRSRFLPKMFRHSRSFHVIFTLAVIVFGMPIYNVHGFQCKRAFKDESKAETEIFGTWCPEEGYLRQCYLLNCSTGYQTRTEWNCAFDAKAVQKCSGSVFETDGFKCQCLVGKEGVEMSNENMTNLDPTTATYTPSTPTTASTYSVLSTQTVKFNKTTLSSFAYRKNSHFETMMKAILLGFAIARAVPVGVHISAV